MHIQATKPDTVGKLLSYRKYLLLFMFVILQAICLFYNEAYIFTVLFILPRHAKLTILHWFFNFLTFLILIFL